MVCHLIYTATKLIHLIFSQRDRSLFYKRKKKKRKIKKILIPILAYTLVFNASFKSHEIPKVSSGKFVCTPVIISQRERGISYHHLQDNYFASAKRLLSTCKPISIAVSNTDDPTLSSLRSSLSSLSLSLGMKGGRSLRATPAKIITTRIFNNADNIPSRSHRGLHSNASWSNTIASVCLFLPDHFLVTDAVVEGLLFISSKLVTSCGETFSRQIDKELSDGEI